MATVPHHSYLTLAKLTDYLELVKFSHTIFALPFALASMLLAAHGLPDKWTVIWILVAMVAARTTAMGFNRIVDREIDKQNPRTQNREIPAGKVSVAEAAARRRKPSRKNRAALSSCAPFRQAAWSCRVEPGIRVDLEPVRRRRR